MNYNDIALERLRSEAITRFTRAGLASEASVDVWQDEMMEDLVVRLRTHVLAHKLAEEDVTASYTETLRVEFHHEPRWLATIPAVGVLATLIIGALTEGSGLAIFLVACMWATLGVIAYALNTPTHEVKEDIREGVVIVPVASYATFPECAFRYPDNVGHPRLTQLPQTAHLRPRQPGEHVSTDDPPPPRKEFAVVSRLRVLESARARFGHLLEGALRASGDSPDKWVWMQVQQLHEESLRGAEEEEARRLRT